jgi:hypothetical protein
LASTHTRTQQQQQQQQRDISGVRGLRAPVCARHCCCRSHASHTAAHSHMSTLTVELSGDAVAAIVERGVHLHLHPRARRRRRNLHAHAGAARSAGAALQACPAAVMIQCAWSCQSGVWEAAEHQVLGNCPDHMDSGARQGCGRPSCNLTSSHSGRAQTPPAATRSQDQPAHAAKVVTRVTVVPVAQPSL